MFWSGSMLHRIYLTDGLDPRPFWTSSPELISCAGTMVGEYDPFIKDLFTGGCVSSASILCSVSGTFFCVIFYLLG